MSFRTYLKFVPREIAILRSVSTQYVLHLAHENGIFHMRLVAKYLERARYFECLAKQEENLRLKRGFKKQTDVYRKLAQARAKQLGVFSSRESPAQQK
jgi:hypothetical protein